MILCRWYRWCTLTFEYLCEFSKKFETVLMGYPGAWGKLVHEKNQKSKISWHCLFKGAQVWDFRLLGFSFHNFYTVKSLREDDFGVKIQIFNKIFRGPFGAAKFLTCMLSLILRSASLQNMLSIRISSWCVPWAYGSGTDAFAVHTHQELKCTPSKRISFLWVCSA